MISTILAASDGSVAAAAAERYAVALAARLKARLTGLSVVEERLIRGLKEDGLGVAPPANDALGAYLDSRAAAACRRLSELARGEGVEIQSETAQGIADDLIVAARTTAVSMLSVIPATILAMVLAVAGAITITSAASAMDT